MNKKANLRASQLAAVLIISYHTHRHRNASIYNNTASEKERHNTSVQATPSNAHHPLTSTCLFSIHHTLLPFNTSLSLTPPSSPHTSHPLPLHPTHLTPSLFTPHISPPPSSPHTSHPLLLHPTHLTPSLFIPHISPPPSSPHTSHPLPLHPTHLTPSPLPYPSPAALPECSPSQ